MTQNPSNAPSTAFAVALLDEFVRLGVRDVVLSPGSRSQALALVAAEFERLGLLRLRVRIDERVGGFLALGLSVETSAPVLIITTSGTAVANLHPAVLEAHHSGVPLVVLSADRPDSLRGIGSNQTAVQPGIFGPAVTRSWDVGAPTGEIGEADAAAAVAREVWVAALEGLGGRRGPVHLNVAFTEPLSSAVVLPEVLGDWEIGGAGSAGAGDSGSYGALGALGASGASGAPGAPGASGDLGADSSVDLPGDALAPDALASDSLAPDSLALLPKPGTVVVAGTGAGEIAERIARELGAPLIAEVASGAHFGPNLVVAYRQLLDTANFGDRIDRVIVFGHPTLSREVPALIQRPGVETVVVRSPGVDDYNPGHVVTQFAEAVHVMGSADASPAGRSWVGRWVMTSRSLIAPDEPSAVDLSNAEFARRQLAVVREPVTRRMLVEAVWSATWPHDRLVLGASRLIREADAAVVGKKIHVHANRGLAGIDGTIATAMGIALASQAAPDVRVGDAPASGPVGSSIDAGTGAAAGPAATTATAAAAPSTAVRPAPASHDATGTTRVLLGDLAALHDSGSLLFGVAETRPRIQVIVGNDNGGTIFDGLEVAASAPVSAMERVMLTGQSVDFEKLAAAYGWAYSRVANRGDLDQALTASGPILIEVPLAR